MSREFASADYTAGQLNAVIKLIKKQAGEDGPERFLRGELVVSKPTHNWIEHNGIIYFPVTSNGLTGPEWIAHFEKKGDHVDDYGKQVLCSHDFMPTNGRTYLVAILKGMLFSDKDRFIRNIRQDASQRKLNTPNAEIACLIRDKFTDAEIEAMGLWAIIAMHEPIEDSDGDLDLLGASRVVDGRRLYACSGRLDRHFITGSGFALVVS